MGWIGRFFYWAKENFGYSKKKVLTNENLSTIKDEHTTQNEKSIFVEMSPKQTPFVLGKSLEVASTTIKPFEGVKMQNGLHIAYVCPAGKWTVGYGHVIIINGKQADSKSHKFDNLPIEWQQLTPQQAEELFKADLMKFYECVQRQIPKVQSLNNNQVGSLISFTYNVGEGNLKKSDLRRYINANTVYDKEKIKELFLRFKTANGKVLKGLINRRIKEVEVFCS